MTEYRFAVDVSLAVSIAAEDEASARAILSDLLPADGADAKAFAYGYDARLYVLGMPTVEEENEVPE
jgi:hypothetical protein